MFYDGTRARRFADARTPWKQAVDFPGAWQMLVLRNFMLDKKLLADGHVPFQELIVGDNPVGAGYAVACVTKSRERAFVYVPTGRSVTLDLSKLRQTGTAKTFSLFNPRTGETIEKVSVTHDENFHVITLPGIEERGNDWIVIIE